MCSAQAPQGLVDVEKEPTEEPDDSSGNLKDLLAGDLATDTYARDENCWTRRPPAQAGNEALEQESGA